MRSHSMTLMACIALAAAVSALAAAPGTNAPDFTIADKIGRAHV